MGIFDWLFGKSKQPKKEVVEQYKIDDDMPASMDTTIEGRKMFKRDMTGLLAYFEERPDMERLYNEFTHLIRNGHTVNEYLNGANVMDDLEVRSTVRKGFDDIAGFLKDMLEIQENEELRKDFNACVEATTILKVESSESFKFSNSFFPASFDKIINKMRELLGNEVFDIIGEQAGFMLDDDHKVDVNIIPSEEQLLVNFFENYQTSYALCGVIAKREKINHSEVINEMIFNVHERERKIPNWIKNLSEPSKIAANALVSTYSFRKNIFAYEEGFELGALDEGIFASSESVFSLFLENGKELDEINDNFKMGVSALLDTFGHGLYLKKEFNSSKIIYSKSIELSPNHPSIAEHITNRGKSKLKLNDKEGAKLDFEKALKKDENFQEAKSLLESIKKTIC